MITTLVLSSQTPPRLALRRKGAEAGDSGTRCAVAEVNSDRTVTFRLWLRKRGCELVGEVLQGKVRRP